MSQVVFDLMPLLVRGLLLDSLLALGIYDGERSSRAGTVRMNKGVTDAGKRSSGALLEHGFRWLGYQQVRATFHLLKNEYNKGIR